MTREQLEALKEWVRASIARQVAARLDSNCDHEYQVEHDKEAALDALFDEPKHEAPKEARRWTPHMHGRGLLQTWRLEDQDGNRLMLEGGLLWTGTRAQAHVHARELNRASADGR